MNRAYLLPLRGFAIAAALCLAGKAAAVTIYNTAPYLGRSDSPFYQGILAGTIYLEDFEDRALNTPYIHANGGRVTPFVNVAVDEDDGVRDERSTFAYSYEPRGGGILSNSIDFSFERDTQGRLPEYVGLAILGHYTGSLDLYTTIRVWDSNGNPLPDDTWLSPATHLPPLTPSDSALGHHFTGIYLEGGVSRIDVMQGLIDHLQYGYAIPEPGSALLLAAASLLTGSRRRAR